MLPEIRVKDWRPHLDLFADHASGAKPGKHILARRGLTGGTPRMRADDLNDTLRDPEV
jgi:hypothetical protein